MLGENVLGTTGHFAEALKSQEADGLAEWDAQGSVYVDILGLHMVCTCINALCCQALLFIFRMRMR
jgi:hypothetical protein